MDNDESVSRARAIAFERQRQAERRPMPNDRKPDRGREPDRGGPNDLARDVFSDAVSLGGYLVVAFVAPIGTACRSSQSSAQPFPAETAAAIVTDMITDAKERWKQRLTQVPPGN